MGLLVFSFIPTFGGLLRIVDLSFGLDFMPANPRAINAPMVIIVHVLSSFVFCVAGIHQFLPSTRRRNRPRHRSVGRWVFCSGLVSAISGLWMTVMFDFPQELQGQALFFARLVVGLGMILFLVRGVIRAVTADFQSHRSDMLKAYALGQGASSQAFMGIGWLMLTGADAEGFTRDVLMISAWVMNFVVADFIGRRPSATNSGIGERRAGYLHH